MSEHNILVVEDEEHISSLLKEIIRLHNANAVIADAASQTFQHLQNYAIDFAIIDLTLPDCNGLQLALDIQKKYPGLKGKILFTSGYEPEPSLLEHLEHSSDRFLAKPFHLDDIRRELKRMLQQ